MRDVRVNVFCNLIVAVLFLAPFSHAVENQARRCDVTKAEEQCGHNERCVQQLVNEEARCECQRDYVLVDGQCLHRKTAMFVTTTAQPESGGGSVAAGLLIPTFLIVVGVLLYLGARRYKWLQRFRLFRPNRHGDILITRDDDDDDDPPIG
ncbi:uncharacterized protein LOC116433842 isoform X1 [Nomia melanderi]|uniref:uncharacterized protein LOC116433842 isoform X1 n=1 Tax=Nomia melanderi TaxID=2448451 RepID=UPI001304567A|nr:uncharacterized protein LOC116433842 isoform X1 [Nomia melanderi]XP_031848249.1 uncharacterized protein LOC116433842 isoform X1 [Nomia melanderi]XP_031848250.1 uncharacterized protein LOC116433842 isoform X1 [Nomia melanderi]